MAEQDAENLIPDDAQSVGSPPLPEAHHAHDHAHHDEAPLTDELDPANRSLAEALRLSFMFLKLIIVFLVILFFGSAWYKVDEGKVAVCVRLGEILGEPGRQAQPPGGPYFAWPEPIDRQIMVPTSPRTVPVLKAFWYQVKPGDETKPLEQQTALSSGSIPGRDGSLITADKNVVHGQWRINYEIEPQDAVRFIQNVGMSDPDTDVLPPEYVGANLEDKSMYRADRLVAAAAERGLVHAVAQSTVDQVITKKEVDYNSVAKPVIQELLDELDSGITVTNVALKEITPPVSVRPAFQEVNIALAEKANKIVRAEKERSSILLSVAGANYVQLLEAVDRYEEVRALGEGSAPDAEQQVVDLLHSDQIRGLAKDIIREAISYRTQVVQDIKGQAESFARLLPQYRKNPRIFRNRLWQDARQAIFSSDNETFYLSQGENTIYLELGRDPIIEFNREHRKYIEEQETERAAREAAASLTLPPPDMPRR